MVLSLLLYAALIPAVAGAVSILIPLRFLGIRSRSRATVVAAVSVVAAIVAATVPASEKRIGKRESRLDDFMPRWQFEERHAIAVRAPPARVFEAVRTVSAGEIRFFGLLTSIRRGGRKGPESILMAPEKQLSLIHI